MAYKYYCDVIVSSNALSFLKKDKMSCCKCCKCCKCKSFEEQVEEVTIAEMMIPIVLGAILLFYVALLVYLILW